MMLIILFLTRILLACVLQYSQDLTRSQDRGQIEYDANGERVYTLWTRYYPFYADYSNFQNYQGIIFRELDQYMRNLLVYYMQINGQKAEHIIYFETGITTQQIFTLEANTQRYEGRWVLMYIYYNNRMGKIYTMLYAAGQSVNDIQLKVFPGVQQNAHYYQYLQDDLTAYGIKMNSFQGFSSFRIPDATEDAYFQTAQQLYDSLQNGCMINNDCQNNQLNELVVSYDSILSDFNFGTDQVTYYNSYSINGWFKLTPYLLAHNAFIVKLVQYGRETDSHNGITALRIDSSYSKQLPNTGGITVQTYSYISPKWNEDASQNANTKFDYRSQVAQENIQTWTYFRFITGVEVSATENAEVYFAFVQKNDQAIHAFPNLNQYQLGRLQIYIGNSPLAKESFAGQIANVQFRSCVTYKPPTQQCHFSCKTCAGPTANDCLDCDADSNRDYNLQTKSCICQTDFLQIDNQPKCQYIKTYMPNIQIQKQKATQAANTCDKGYFLVHDTGQCLQCPQQQLGSTLLCGDCLDKPFDWVNSLNCTYDYKQIGDVNIDAYQKIYRDATQIDLYLLFGNQSDATLQYYPGGSGICYDATFQYCNAITFNSQSFNVYCRKNYVYDLINQSCQYTVDNCLEADEKQCSKCESGYYLTDKFNCDSCSENCQSCQSNGSIAICQLCLAGYTVVENICQKCGIFCKKCQYDNAYQFVRCIVCQSSDYFLMFDGINCSPNTISDCLYQYQYTQDLTNTISLNYQPKSQLGVQTVCATCKDGLINKFTECIHPDSMLGVTFEDVLIQPPPANNLVYLYFSADSSKQVSQTTSDCKISQCIYCVVYNGNNYCVKCNDGYYAQIFNGQCIPCPQIQNCLTCLQQNKIYEDAWKWSVRLLYQFFFSMQPDFTLSSVTNISDYEVICTICKGGYELYNNLCIPACPSSCTQCYKQNNQNICQRCPASTQGYVFSIYNNTCIKCPYNCQLCQPRTKEQISYINPYFNPDDESNLIYSYICLKEIKDQPDLQYNKALGQFIQCKDIDDFCGQSIQFEIKIYCDDEKFQSDYDIAKNNNSGDDFLKQNIQLNQLFSLELDDTHIPYVFYLLLYQIENSIMIAYMNQQQTSSVTFKFQFPSDPDTCNINSETGFYTNLPYNVFSLQEVNIIIDFKNQKINIADSVGIECFKNVLLLNAQLYQGSTLFILHILNVHLTIDNLTILGSSQQNFQVNITNPKSITVNNLQMIQLTFNNTLGFFAYILQNPQLKDISFNFSNILIQQSQFINTYFVLFPTELEVNSEFYNFNISQTNFNSKSCIFKEGDLPKLNGILKLHEFNLEGVRLDNSLIIDCNLYGIQISNNFPDQYNKISGYLFNSSLFRGKEMSIKQTKFNTIILSNFSTLIDASGVTVTDDIYNFILESCQFYYIQYSQDSLLIQQTQNNIQSTFTIQSCSFTNYYIDSENFTTSSFLIYVWSKNATISDTKFTRGEGKTDFLFLDLFSIKFDNVTINGLNTQGLHPSLDCLVKLVPIQNYNSFMVIQNVSNFVFSNSNVEEMMTNSYSIIKFEIIDKSQTIDIQFTNVKFLNNLLINTGQENTASIIQLNSQYLGQLTIKDCIFQYNVMNSYVQNYEMISGTLMQINALLLKVQIDNLLIDTNYMFNSSDSLIYIHSKFLYISNSRFLNSNIYNDILIKFVIWNTQLGYTVYQESFFNKFPIKSVGGVAKMQARSVQITNSQFINSTAIRGAGLYLQILTSISIDSTNFINLQNKLSSLISNGGALYIYLDGGISALNITNTNFTNIYSLKSGGAIYIDAQYSTISIYLMLINFKNVYSFSGSILYIIQDQNSNINMENVNVIDSYQAFRQYLNNFDDIENQDIITYQSNNQLFYVQYGSVFIQNLNCFYLYMRGFLYIDKAVFITLTSIQISNIFLSTNNLITIFPYQYQRTQIQIFSMKITNGTTINNTSAYCSPIVQQFQEDFKCIVTQTPPTTMIKGYDNVNNRTDCFMQSFNYYSGQLNLIYIDSIQTVDILQVNKLTILNVNCTYCSQGLVRIQKIQLNETESNNIILNEVYMQNNTCGQGCLILTSNSQFTLQTLSRRLLVELEASKFEQPFTVKLFNSVFLKNNAQFGSLIIDSLSILVTDCVFLSNVASLSGGAINYQGNGNTSINIFSSLVSNNTAKVGGAFYFLGFQLSDPTLLQLLIESNQAQEYGKDSSQNPISLSVSFDSGKTIENTQRIISTSTQIVDQVEIYPYLLIGQITPTKIKVFPSGQMLKDYKYYNSTSSNYINYNLSLQILALDKLRQIQKNLDSTYCLLRQRTINISNINESIPFSSDKLSITNVSFNSTTLKYNLDDLAIKFDPYQDKDLVFQIQFYCPYVKVPVLNTQPPYNIKSYITNYTLRLNVQTFQCQKGEVFNQNEGTCLQCDSSQQYYSVKFGSQCQIKDDVTTKAVRSAQIQLKHGYWRPYDDSTVIEYCLHLDSNCEGGWIPGDTSCTIGHIGALCEQCDLYNQRGSGRYALSGNYICGSCDSISGNGITIGFITLWTLISVLMSVRGTLEMVDQIIGSLKAMAIGLVVSVDKSGSVAILMKILTNYLQIVSSITTFQLKFPTAIDSIFTTLGNPVQSMAYSLDCFLVDISTIQTLYFRIIWALIMPLFYITIFFALYSIAIALNKAKYNVSIISTTLIYMYMYLQPNLIGGLISLLSYRLISQVYWVQGNVAYVYNSDSHIKWVLSFVSPCLIVIGFVIPFYLYNRLTRVKNELGKIENVQLLGFLYNEYRKENYYWEIVKIMQKELIIIFLTFYQDLIVIKAALIFIVIFLYDLLTKSKKPYLRTDLNELDEQSSFICAFSIVLGMTIYNADSSGHQEIVWPFYLLISVFNICFLIKLFFMILLGYADQLRYQLDLIRDKVNQKYPQIQQYHPYLRRLMQNSHQSSKRAKQRFRKIKEYLMPQARQIAKFKSENNIFTYDQDSQAPEINQDAKVHPEQEINSIKPKLIIQDKEQISEKSISSPKSNQKKKSQIQKQDFEHHSLIQHDYLIKSPIQSQESESVAISLQRDNVQEKSQNYQIHEFQE